MKKIFNLQQTTYDVISTLTKNEDLIKMLTAQYGDYGLTPKKSSFKCMPKLLNIILRWQFLLEFF